MEKAIAKLAADGLDPGELEDREAEKIRKLVERKRQHGKDVVEARDVEPEDGEERQPVDLVRALAASLGGRRGPRAVRPRTSTRPTATRRARKRG